MSSSSQPQHTFTTTYVHTEGSVSLAHSPDVSFLYSGGADGIRCFDLNQSDAAKTIEYHNEPVTYLDCSAEHLASCSESGEVVLHDHAVSAGDSPSFKCLVTRTSLPARCIKFSPSQKKLAVSSDELIVKIVDVCDPLNCQLLTGHTKSIKSVSWSPDSSQLISSGCDGTLRLWNLYNHNSSHNLTCVQVIENVIPSVLPESHHSIEVAWHPTGKIFVVPSRDRGLAIFAKTTSPNTPWKMVKSVCQAQDTADVGRTKPFTALKFSSNGKYLAVGCEDGLIMVWSAQNWKRICHIQPEPHCAITAIDWRPQANILIIGNLNGQITTWQDVISSPQPPPFNDRPIVLSQRGRGSMASEEEEETSIQDISESYNGAAYVGGDVEIDYQGLDKTKSKKSSRSRNKELSDRLLLAHSSMHHAQEPFQPGATTSSHAFDSNIGTNRRYMAFNQLGVVYVLEKEQENIITVEFHDKSKMNGYHFTDYLKFHLSSIGDLGVAFACGSTKSNPSIIRYEPFESWATSGFAFHRSEQIGIDEDACWQYNLPDGENVTCIACGGHPNQHVEMEVEGLTGSGAIVVGTNKGFVRLFTGSGIQRYIWNLGRQIISLACNNEFVIAVYKSSISPQSDLHYCIMDHTTFEIIQESVIPLPNSRTFLTWIGFSQPHSIPALYDSSGMLSFLDKVRRPRQARWVPVLDTMSLRTEAQLSRFYWPIGVSPTELSCIILKGGETQPGFPIPLVQEIPLQMPALRLNEPQGQLEENYLRDSIIYSHQEDLANPEDYSLASQLGFLQLELDKKLLKLVETGCKAEPTPQLQKALDYASYLKNMNTLEASMKIAKFYNLAGLYERVSKAHEAKQLQRKLDGPEKRLSKYSHLEDHRILTSSILSAKPKHRAHHEEWMSRSPKNTSSNFQQPNRIFSKKNVFKSPAPRSKMDSQTAEATEDEDHVEDKEELDSNVPFESSSIMQSGEDGLENNMLSVAQQSNQTSDSFSTKALRSISNHVSSSPVPSTNPFASKRLTANTKTNDLKKSDRFFDRVDQLHHTDNKNLKPPEKTRQLTLFGLPSKPPNADHGRIKTGKKRKNDGSDDNINPDTKNAKLQAEKPHPGIPKYTNDDEHEDLELDASEIGDIQVNDGTFTRKNESTEEESQISLTSIDFSQSLPPRIRSTLPDPQNFDEMEESQELSIPNEVEESMSKGTNKLAQFRSKH
ncbi:hypothetical protein O181_009098 [Austropuccinia psidii MF-1]|uniref:Minichromosome loss protein Mcl1 middle region domain-containing protein n=1 Tax=Austropuccinia psidii MF-1 TaxID=1389203 RepID=A0A9Q3BQF7_9BASI|nr:hypothetical protein [Austropuccinia psidii MF-1]